MRLEEYQRRAFATARIDWDDPRKRHIPMFGVVGELGSLTSELKKTLRDGKAYTDGAHNLIEEFGNLLWYVGAIASRHNLRLQVLADRAKTADAPSSSFGHIYAMVSAFAALVAVIADLETELTGVRRRPAVQNGNAVEPTLSAPHNRSPCRDRSSSRDSNDAVQC